MNPKIFPTGLRICHAIDPADVDVIFVHGLTGGREKTWTGDSSAQPWFESLLPSSCPTARILAYGYDAYVEDYCSVVSESRVENYGKRLLAAVAQQRESDGTNNRSIVFVTHGLGGLVCMKALLASKNSGEEHVKAILHATIGIGFLGTPQSAPAWIRWAELTSKYIGVLMQENSDIMKVLEASSEALAQIQTEFHIMLRDLVQREAKRLEIACFYEELPLPGIGVVVPQNSAILPQSPAIGIHANHRQMSKFSETEDPGFKSVVRELQRWIGADQTGVESTPAQMASLSYGAWASLIQTPASSEREYPSTLFLNMDWDLLRDALSPKQVYKEHRTHRRRLLPDTAMWLFELEGYKKWKTKDAESQLLWISGLPGCGKSILACSVVEQLHHEADPLSENLQPFYYYCSHDSVDCLEQSYSVLRSVAYQMAQQRRHFAANLCDVLRGYGPFQTYRCIKDIIPCDAFWDLLKRVVQAASAEFGAMFVVIDGLDEAAVPDRAVLIDCISGLCNELPSCRILITSRDDDDIREHVSLARATEIRMSEEFNTPDIRKYITNRVSTWGALGSTKTKDQFIESLSKRANGVFLWAKLVMDELERLHDMDEVIEALETFPSSMKELYNTIFQNLSTRLDNQELRLSQSIISWAALAQKTLTLQEMASALCLHGKFSASTLRLLIKRLCGSLIVIGDPGPQTQASSVSLVHASLAEYLKSENDPQCKYSLNYSETHRAIALGCFEQLKMVSQCPLFYPIGLSTVYNLSLYQVGERAASWTVDGPGAIDPNSPPHEAATSFVIWPFVEMQYPLFSYVRDSWAYHMEQSAYNLLAGEAVAKEFMGLLLQATPLLIWLRQVDLRLEVRKDCVTRLIRFCNLLRQSEYLGVDIIYDFVLHLANGGSSGCIYRLGKWKGLAIEQSPLKVSEMGQTSEHILSENRRRLRRGVMAHQDEEHLLALQEFVDACGIRLPAQSSFENLTQYAAAARRSIFDAIVDHTCKGTDIWLLMLFGQTLAQHGNTDWLAEFVSSMGSNRSSNISVLESKAQLVCYIGDYGAAAALYSKLCVRSKRWDLKEALISALYFDGRVGEVLDVLASYNLVSDSRQQWCLLAWNEERRAELCISRGKYKQAATICAKATRKYPEWWNLWELLGKCLIHLGDLPVALDCFRAAQRQPRFAFAASQRLVESLLRDGQYDFAIAESLWTIRRFPHHWRSYDNLWGSWLACPEHYKVRILDALKEITMGPNPPWMAFVHYARASMQRNLYPQALKACQDSLAIRKTPAAIYTAAKAYEALNQPEEALNTLVSAPLHRYIFPDKYLRYIAYLYWKLERQPDFERTRQHAKSIIRRSALGQSKKLARRHYHAKNYVDCEQECREGLANSRDTAKDQELGRDDNVLKAEQEERESETQQLVVILTLALAAQSLPCLALHECIKMVSDHPFRWFILGDLFASEKHPDLASFCYDAGLQEQQPDPTAETHAALRLFHEDWQCEGCKVRDSGEVGYICLRCELLGVCAGCYERVREEHGRDHEWIRCPSVAYPRLKIWEEGGARKREIIGMEKEKRDRMMDFWSQW